MGVVALVAGGSFVSSMVTLGIFERTKKAWLGWAESYSFLVLYVSLTILVVGVHGDIVDSTPVLVWIATAIGLIGTLTCLSAQTATLFFGVPFTRVAVLTTIGFSGILLWLGGVSAAGVIGGSLPDGLGWLGIGVVLVSGSVIGLMSRDRALIRAERTPTTAEMTAGSVPFVGVVVWLVWLAVEMM